MSGAKNVEFSLKVMINKHKTKVLFAEADSDFADVLFSFMTLPLGRILKILQKHYGDPAPVIGSLNTLYNGLDNLDTDHFWTEGGKKMLLDPRSLYDEDCNKLKLKINDYQPIKYFTCEDNSCGRWNLSIYYGSARCECGKTLNKEIQFAASSQGDAAGVFSTPDASFIISDDMQMAPNVAGCFLLRTLRNLEITGVERGELRNVTFGYNEIIGLLKGMFVSRTPLTDLVLGKAPNDDSFAPGISLPTTEIVTASNTKKMIVKLMVQKSRKKLLFAQAEEDFVEFLFSLLTIPLGGVESLLGNITSLTSVDNLYSSIRSINGEKLLKSTSARTKLLKPELPFGYISPNQILPLTEGVRPSLYFGRDYRFELYLSPSKRRINCWDVRSIKSPKGDGNYVKGPGKYMVTDDLTVTPLCVSTALAIFKRLEIPLSDVEEIELSIGLDEGLRILKASLTSTSVLTDSFIKPLITKRVKQEY